MRAVQTMSIGQKDSYKSLFSVWKEIFTMPRPKRYGHITLFYYAREYTGCVVMLGIVNGKRKGMGTY